MQFLFNPRYTIASLDSGTSAGKFATSFDNTIIRLSDTADEAISYADTYESLRMVAFNVDCESLLRHAVEPAEELCNV